MPFKFNLGIEARHNWIKSRSIVRRITTSGKRMCFNKRVEFLEESAPLESKTHNSFYS